MGKKLLQQEGLLTHTGSAKQGTLQILQTWAEEVPLKHALALAHGFLIEQAVPPLVCRQAVAVT